MQPVLKRSTKLEREFYRELHNIADRARGRVAASFVDAIHNFKSQVEFQELIRFIEQGDARAVQQILGIDVVAHELRPMMTQLQQIYVAAAVKAAEVQLTTLAPNLAFDLVNPRSVDFLRTYSFSLIQSISHTTKEGIRVIVQDAFESGGSPAQQARKIMETLGLTKRQATAVRNFIEMLEAEGVKTSVINRRVKRFAERQLRMRATMIARTETIRAANAGQRQLWEQAADNGFIDRGGARKVWIITPDDRLCPVCRPIPDMNPEGVPIGGVFNTPIGAVSEPPAHPHCRCATGLQFPDE